MSRSPHSLSVSFNALDRVDDTYCSVENRETTINFETEVLMAGSVDEVDCFGVFSRSKCLMKRPVECDCS
jgi:hypothetical protein